MQHIWGNGWASCFERHFAQLFPHVWGGKIQLENTVSRHTTNSTNMQANERKNNFKPCRHTDCPFLSPKPRIAFKHTDCTRPRTLSPISRKLMANILPQPPGSISFFERTKESSQRSSLSAIEYSPVFNLKKRQKKVWHLFEKTSKITKLFYLFQIYILCFTSPTPLFQFCERKKKQL